MRRRRRPEALLAALLLLTGAPALAAQDVSRPDVAAPATPDQPQLALFGTIPIYWGEGDGMEDVLAGTATAHWARALLEQHLALHPLATLLAEDLAGHHALLIAQPRVLNPAENVALDQWVRAGGRVLLFADPLLSAESRYPLGDRRRPQDVVLLSPLLRHWGLDLRFDADQAPVRQVREIAGILLPHQVSGTFATLPESTGCVLQGAEILADCVVGEGHVVILADAAVLDLYHPPAGAEEALLALVQRALAPTGSIKQNNDLADPPDLQPVDKAVHNNP
ncbi:motility-associated ABC transporter substrate-binding family protein [Croceibacterium mercuriale]|uniref:ABC transporter n=1 Tax=Croceibacterium mercuriale TaxID=1572751 RepID=UPI000B131895|nr:ABC transporter [Croceibacterium mercuriale]